MTREYSLIVLLLILVACLAGYTGGVFHGQYATFYDLCGPCEEEDIGKTCIGHNSTSLCLGDGWLKVDQEALTKTLENEVVEETIGELKL